MANNEDGAAREDGEAPAAVGWRAHLWWLIGAAVLLVGLTVGATLWWLMSSTESDGEAAAEAAAAQQSGHGSALYYPLRPAFVVDFEHRGRLRYLQVSITLMARDAAVIDAVQLHMPLIRNQVVLLLGGEDFEGLQTDEGRELARLNLLEAIRAILQQEIGQPGIEQVLFTNFVMQ